MTDTNRAYIAQAKSTDWETPLELFDRLWDEFGGFDLDPCCQRGQYTAVKILQNGGVICIPPFAYQGSDPQIYKDGLAQPWFGKVFMNPP